jgi:hypothetical protein
MVIQNSSCCGLISSVFISKLASNFITVNCGDPCLLILMSEEALSLLYPN